MHKILKQFSDLTTSELYAIMRLRGQVFVLEQNCPYVDADNLDQEAWHLWYELNSRPIAYARILKPGAYYKEASIGRVVTATSFRGKAVGKKLFKDCIAETRHLFPKSAIRIMAQSYLIRFYEAFDFKVVSEEFLEDGIPHVEMLLSRS